MFRANDRFISEIFRHATFVLVYWLKHFASPVFLIVGILWNCKIHETCVEICVIAYINWASKIFVIRISNERELKFEIIGRFINFTWVSNACTVDGYLCTDSTKINHPEPYICMYWTNFRQPTALIQLNIFGKIPTEVCSPHLYASFGTFYAQIGQLFEAQWVFEVCLKIDN